jgi:hypothetical protein
MIRTQTDERRLTVSCVVEWTTADNLSDSVIVDASALGYSDLAVETLTGWATPSLSWTLEFAGTSDELIYHYVADETADKPPKNVRVDYFLGELYGLPCQTSGGTGDIVLTTAGAADGVTLSFVLQLIRPGLVRTRGLDLSYVIRR